LKCLKNVYSQLDAKYTSKRRKRNSPNAINFYIKTVRIMYNGIKKNAVTVGEDIIKSS